MYCKRCGKQYKETQYSSEYDTQTGEILERVTKYYHSMWDYVLRACPHSEYKFEKTKKS